jgi:hypothetical protein
MRFIIIIPVLLFAFISCKKPESIAPKPTSPLSTKASIWVDRDGTVFIQPKVRFDSLKNTFFVTLDTSKDYNLIKYEMDLHIYTEGQLSMEKISVFDYRNSTYFEVGDGFGKTVKYKIEPVISTIVTKADYNFNSYSEDGFNVVLNKNLSWETKMAFTDGNSTIDAGFSPIYHDQFADSLDNLCVGTQLFENYPFKVDNDTILMSNYQQFSKYNAIYHSVCGIEVPRNILNREVFFNQKNYKNIKLHYGFYLPLASETYDFSIDFLGYNAFLNTVDFDLNFKAKSNYQTETTYGIVISGKTEYRNICIDHDPVFGY